MLVSGVRSSWEASARKRRSFSSVAARSANASSMRAEHRVQAEAEPADLRPRLGRLARAA